MYMCMKKSSMSSVLEIGAKRDFEHDGKGRRRAIIYVDGGEFHAYDLEAWHEEHHACL